MMRNRLSGVALLVLSLSGSIGFAAESDADQAEWIALKGVNRSTPTELEEVVDADSLLAIRTFRSGKDKNLGNEDDAFYASPAQLREQAGLDPEEMDALREYAVQKLGAPADPFSTNSCVGAPLTAKEARRWIPIPHSNELPVGQFEGHARRRFCYEGAICKPWESLPSNFPVTLTTFSYHQDQRLSECAGLQGSFPMPPLRGEMILELRTEQPRLILQSETNDKGQRFYNFSGFDAKNGDIPWLLYMEAGETAQIRNCPISRLHGLAQPGMNYFKFNSLTATQSCVRLANHWKQEMKDDKGNATYWEYELVLLGNLEPPCESD